MIIVKFTVYEFWSLYDKYANIQELLGISCCFPVAATTVISTTMWFSEPVKATMCNRSTFCCFKGDISSTGRSGLDGIFLTLQLVVDDSNITVSSQLHLYYKWFNTGCDMVLAGWAMLHRPLRQCSSVKSCGNGIVLEMYLAPILLPGKDLYIYSAL